MRQALADVVLGMVVAVDAHRFFRAGIGDLDVQGVALAVNANRDFAPFG